MWGKYAKPLAFGLLGLQEALRVALHVFGSPVLGH
jgi:hypothetical protein